MSVLSQVIDPPDKSTPAWEAIQSQRLVADVLDDFRRELNDADITPEERDVYMRCLTGITAALSPANIVHAAPQAKLAITDVDLNSLEHIDVRLGASISELELDNDDFADLIKAVESALEAVKDSDLPKELKDFMCSQLLRVKSAIDQYRFRGIEGVTEAVAGFVGVMAIAEPQITAAMSKESRLSLKQVLDCSQSVIALAHGAAWVWPHLLIGAGIVAKALGVG